MREELLMEIRYPSRPDRLTVMRAALCRLFESLQLDGQLCQRLVLAVNEACMNVIQHAYKGAEDQLLIVEVARDEEGLLFRITDFADAVDVTLIEPRCLDQVRPRGLGIHFMRAIMDQISFESLAQGRGNRLTMRKQIAFPQHSEGASSVCEISNSVSSASNEF